MKNIILVFALGVIAYFALDAVANWAYQQQHRRTSVPLTEPASLGTSSNYDTPPLVISTPDPEYSDEARTAKFQGTIVVKFTVERDGTTSHVKVIHPSGMDMDEKAVQAVTRWKFKPATKDGKPVAVVLTSELGFKLQTPAVDSKRRQTEQGGESEEMDESAARRVQAYAAHFYNPCLPENLQRWIAKNTFEDQRPLVSAARQLCGVRTPRNPFAAARTLWLIVNGPENVQIPSAWAARDLLDANQILIDLLAVGADGLPAHPRVAMNQVLVGLCISPGWDMFQFRLADQLLILQNHVLSPAEIKWNLDRAPCPEAARTLIFSSRYFREGRGSTEANAIDREKVLDDAIHPLRHMKSGEDDGPPVLRRKPN